MVKQIQIPFLFVLSLAAQLLYAQESKLNPETLRSLYKSAIEQYQVPGMAVVLIKNDSLILKQGFGYQSIRKKEKVNANTIFGIASLSKTFTAAMVAKTVNQNKLSFDTKITGKMPLFKLYDPYVTSQVTIKDALAHRTGLNNFSGDLIWYGSKINDSAIISRMRHLQPEYGFRSHFGYSNIMYLVVGKILEKTLNNTFNHLLDSIFFEPLQMTNTTAKYASAMQNQNLAKPHITKNNSVIKHNYISWDNMIPAGGLFSSAADMEKYIKMWLNNGKYRHHQIIPARDMRKLWHQQVPTEPSWLDTKLHAPVNFKSYGMGWAMMNYKEHKVLYHSGGLDGMVCQIALIPDQKAGAIFMANKTTPLPTILMYDFLDRMLNNGDKNYTTEALDILKSYKKSQQLEKPHYASNNDTKPDFYTGIYFDSLVGKASLYVINDTLKINWLESNIFEGYLQQTDMLSYRLNWPLIPSLQSGTVHFEVNGLGKIEGFTIKLVNPDLHFDELKFLKIQNE